MGAPGGDGGCVGFGAWRDVAGVAGLRVGDGAAGADVLGIVLERVCRELGVQHTSFLVSMAGKELSKPSNSSASAEGCWISEKSPPSRSLSPSSTVALCCSPDEKRSASSPSTARSRSKKLPPAGASLC